MYGLDVTHQNQSILMMAQGRNVDQNTTFIAIEGQALGEATKDTLLFVVYCVS